MSLSHLNFLIVDDISTMRSAMRRIVEDMEAVHISLCGTGEEAIEQMGAKTYDVVICDYNLGEGKDGQQVLEEARQRRLIGVSSAFVMVTAEAQRPMVLGALEFQPDEYLVKPIQKDVAMHRIKRAIARKRDMKALDEALAARDHARAITICDKQAAANPAQALDLLRIKAELCIVIGDYDQAEALYQQALAERDFLWARFGLGKLQVLREQYAEAQQSLEQLITDSAYVLEPYDWLAQALEAQGAVEAAQATLQAATELSPKSVRRQRRLGDLAMRNGQTAVAETAYRRAIQEGRGSYLASAGEYIELAAMLGARSMTKGLAALGEGRVALRAHPGEELRIAVWQALTYANNGLPKDAKRFLTQALQIFPRCSKDLPAESQLELARACLMLEETAQGVEIVKRAIREAYDNAELMERAATLLKEFGIEEDCAGIIDGAREEVARFNNMGVKLFEEGKSDEAARLLMVAADRLPRNRTINMNAVKILLNMMLRNGPDEKHLACTAKYLDRLCKLGDKSEQFREVQRTYRELLAA
ncbi:MAG: response regulator [Nevskia sp.]|nr:response regulator [Nevskia sp.]